MNETRVYFPIEVKKRDLIARVAFAIKCAQKNLAVVIGDKASVFRRRHDMQNGIYFFKSIQPNQFEFIEELRKKNFKIAAMDEEGLMFFDHETYTRRFSEKNFELTDIFFSWGDKEKKALLSKYPDYEKKIIPVGNPRIDIIKKPISKIYEKETEYIKKKYGNYILLTTKFCRQNPVRRGWRTYYQGQRMAGYIVSDANRRMSILSQHHEKKNINKFVEFIKNFSLKFPNEKMIVRVHPAEEKSFWIKKLKNLKNIIVNYDEISTNSYILASKFVIQSNCTTSLESFLLEKFSINYLPFQREEVEYKVPKIVSKNIFNENDLIDFIRNNKNFSRKKLKDDEKKDLKSFVDNFSNDDCSYNIAEGLNSIKFDITKKDRYSNILNFYYIKLKNILRNIFYSLKKRSEYEKGLAKLQRQKIPSLSRKEIIKIKNEICLSLNIDSKKITVKEIYPDMFEFKMNKN